MARNIGVGLNFREGKIHNVAMLQKFIPLKPDTDTGKFNTDYTTPLPDIVTTNISRYVVAS